MKKKGILEASITDILGMIGLELGISLCKLNTIKDYLSTEPFGSSTTFRKTMSNDRFLKLRVNLSFYRDRNWDETNNNSMVRNDPLYFVHPI